MSLIGTIIGGIVLAVAGYFILKLTLGWIMNKIDEYFSNKETDAVNTKIDATVVADIDEMMDKCQNRKSYELLKKEREKGYTHVMGKISGGKLTGDVDLVKDENDTLDPEVKTLLGPEKMVIIER